MMRLTRHAVRLTLHVVQPIQPPLQLSLQSYQILKKVFSDFIRAKHCLLFAKSAKKWSNPKKKNIYITL